MRKELTNGGAIDFRDTPSFKADPMTNEEAMAGGMGAQLEPSIGNDALDVLAYLRERIADHKVQCTGYSIARQRRKFVYTIEVEEPFS